jgi:hypothetical protein
MGRRGTNVRNVGIKIGSLGLLHSSDSMSRIFQVCAGDFIYTYAKAQAVREKSSIEPSQSRCINRVITTMRCNPCDKNTVYQQVPSKQALYVHL